MRAERSSAAATLGADETVQITACSPESRLTLQASRHASGSACVSGGRLRITIILLGQQNE